MLKNDFFHSNLKLQAACHKLRCAVNDNPDFFAGLELPVNVQHESHEERRLRHMGTVAILSIALTKILGVFH